MEEPAGRDPILGNLRRIAEEGTILRWVCSQQLQDCLRK